MRNNLFFTKMQTLKIKTWSWVMSFDTIFKFRISKEVIITIFWTKAIHKLSAESPVLGSNGALLHEEKFATEKLISHTFNL